MTLNTATEKRCSSCGEVKDVSEFYKNRSKRDGLQHACGVCCRAYHKAYNQTEKRKAANKAYNQTEKRKAANKAYNQTEKRKACQKAYNQTEKRKAANKAYNQTEKRKAANKAYSQSEKRKAANKAYSQSEKRKAANKAYHKAHSLAMTDSYVRRELQVQYKITNDQITPEMIELKREQLTIHRLKKEAQNGTT